MEAYYIYINIYTYIFDIYSLYIIHILGILSEYGGIYIIIYIGCYMNCDVTYMYLCIYQECNIMTNLDTLK